MTFNFKENKIIVYGVAFIVLLILLFYLFTRWNNSNNNEDMLKQAKANKEVALELQKESNLKIKSENDSLSRLTKELYSLLSKEQKKPPVKIPIYYETLVFINADDATVIKSITKSANRYRETKQRQLQNIK
jgi:apolipoprotein N-acyltransferase